jgi:hypothetical protein
MSTSGHNPNNIAIIKQATICHQGLIDTVEFQSIGF